MLFHAPFPIDPHPTSASRLRPLRMLEAFEEIGYRVHRVTGAPRQRALAHRTARRRLRAGQRFELLYSENSTQPNLLATSVRGGIAPFLDARILLWARRRGIPAGEFYRDVYWPILHLLAQRPHAARRADEPAVPAGSRRAAPGTDPPVPPLGEDGADRARPGASQQRAAAGGDRRRVRDAGGAPPAVRGRAGARVRARRMRRGGSRRRLRRRSRCVSPGRSGRPTALSTSTTWGSGSAWSMPRGRSWNRCTRRPRHACCSSSPASTARSPRP